MSIGSGGIVNFGPPKSPKSKEDNSDSDAMARRREGRKESPFTSSTKPRRECQIVAGPEISMKAIVKAGCSTKSQ